MCRGIACRHYIYRSPVQLRDETSLRRFYAMAASLKLELAAARADLLGSLFSRPHSVLRIGLRSLQRLAHPSSGTRNLAADPRIGRAQSVSKHR
jgi:hypothetical protein